MKKQMLKLGMGRGVFAGLAGPLLFTVAAVTACEGEYRPLQPATGDESEPTRSHRRRRERAECLD